MDKEVEQTNSYKNGKWNKLNMVGQVKLVSSNIIIIILRIIQGQSLRSKIRQWWYEQVMRVDHWNNHCQ